MRPIMIYMKYINELQKTLFHFFDQNKARPVSIQKRSDGLLNPWRILRKTQMSNNVKKTLSVIKYSD